MDFTFLFDIEHLLLSDLQECVAPDFTISRDSRLKETFYTPSFLTHLGKIEFDSNRQKVFAYSRANYTPAPDNGTTPFHELRKTMLEKMEYLESFLSMMWFVKDCSTSCRNAIGEIAGRNYIETTHSNTYARNSLGLSQPVEFSKSDLSYLDKIIKKYSTICTEKQLDYNSFKDELKPGETYQIGRNRDFNYNDYNALQRALVFLAGARKIEYLPQRIAMYMPIFECLFTIDAVEVTHKVSERVAFYLSDEKEERKRLFQCMKDCYDMRSKFLHGKQFKNAHTDINIAKPLSIQIDDIARKILTRIIMEDSEKFLDKNDKRLKSYLENIIFD